MSHRLQLAILLSLALVHGVQYSLLMPPWGLVDEIQHFDYIGHIAEHGVFPVTGETLLAPDRIASLFETRHWDRFHWATPPSAAIEDLGPVGYSYEGYQPPLFYLVAVPFYLATADSVLTRLYLLRLVMVGLSLFTVFFCFQTADLFSRDTGFAFLSTLVLISIPERTLATSRLNNDVLLEVLSAALAYAVARGVSAGFSSRRLLAVGMLLGLGILTKFSMFFWAAPVAVALWIARRSLSWRQVLWVLVPFLVAAVFLLVRNLAVYGDLIGYTAFHALYAITPPPLSVTGILESLFALFRYFWLIWWKGAQVSGNLAVELFYGVLWLAALLSALRWTVVLRQAYAAQRWLHPLPVAGVFAAAVLVYGGAILASYFRGMIPVVQGRFFAPSMIPCLMLLTFGLWRYRRGAYLLAALSFVLFAGSLLLLWGGLLPYHYYWSEVSAWPAAGEMVSALRVFTGNLSSDKPAFVQRLQPLAVVAFVGAWSILWIALVRLLTVRSVRHDAPATY